MDSLWQEKDADWVHRRDGGGEGGIRHHAAHHSRRSLHALRRGRIAFFL